MSEIIEQFDTDFEIYFDEELVPAQQWADSPDYLRGGLSRMAFSNTEYGQWLRAMGIEYDVFFKGWPPTMAHIMLDDRGHSALFKMKFL